MAVAFVVLVAVWCALASWLGSHRAIVAAVERFGRWIVPVVFIGVGALVLARFGVVAR